MKVLVANLAGPLEAYTPLTDAGHEIVFGRTDDRAREPYTEGELLELCKDVSAVIGPPPALGRTVMEACSQLHTLVVPIIGYERVDLEAATELGVMVCNSPTPENFVSVAESSIALMTMLAKRMKRKEARVRNGEWSQGSDRGFLLWQKTVGLVGLGRTGSEVAKRLVGWDVNLIAYDPYVAAERAEAMGVKMVDLETLMRESDFVSIHVVVTPETYNMIGEEQLRMMKPGAYIVNTSRGEAIEEGAMQRAIEENWIAGAALDVFHQEPLPVDSPMRSLDRERVIVTPHNIAHTEASLHANRRLAVDSTLKALNGEAPEPCVNPDVLPKWRRLAGSQG